MNKKILGGVSALAVGVVGTGVYLAVPAAAGSSPSTPAPAKAAERHPGKRVRAARAARGIHGQATVRTKKGFAQVDWQRGTLTATSGGTLSVRSADGVTWQWKTDGNTKVRKGGAKSTVANLATGDFVVVLGRDASGARTAKRVVVPKKVPARATASPAPSHS
ncbi:DUF5666 domain-containing protein [Actinoallomurus rhizosphaericola]|uniref:DUF5666 domain-containing protein n=1 Tax=Actinoallomurus rhizosphaericola TaxID=2952536 RepID=UPI0020900098|nr:DUF5666 domain-containing protein [Actinoallomurus rhizosphaericola]MCO5993076.1 hypothetical protein [Actinoallomurus rhizosphaericola]